MNDSQLYKAKEVKKKGYFELATYYIIPIVSVVGFLVIIGLPVLNNISAIRKKNADIKIKEQEIVSLNQKVDDLEELKKSDPDTAAYLQKINRIVPSKASEVVSFVTEIENLATSESLEKVEQRTSESNENINDNPFETDDDTASLKSIKNTFNFKGDDVKMKTFLDDLYNKKDFIILSTLKMQGPKGRIFEQKESALNGNTSDSQGELLDLWTIDVQFAKYIFSENFSQSLKDQKVDIKTPPDQDTLDLIDSRY